MTDPVPPADNKEMIEHAWNYFALHAGQRISVFNFFVVLSGALCTGLASTLRGPRHLSWMGAILGLLLVLVSIVFLKLDQRTSFLVKHAEAALAHLEGRFEHDVARLVASEPHRTEEARKKPIRGMWSYGLAFKVVFGTVALIGVAGASLSIARQFFCICWLG